MISSSHGEEFDNKLPSLHCSLPESRRFDFMGFKMRLNRPTERPSTSITSSIVFLESPTSPLEPYDRVTVATYVNKSCLDSWNNPEHATDSHPSKFQTEGKRFDFHPQSNSTTIPNRICNGKLSGCELVYLTDDESWFSLAYKSSTQWFISLGTFTGSKKVTVTLIWSVIPCTVLDLKISRSRSTIQYFAPGMPRSNPQLNAHLDNC
jgi:hypothetical protein